MATSASLGAVIGQTGMLTTYTEGLKVPVTVKDARQVYGRTDYLISPVGGSGEKWVEQFRVTDLQIPTTDGRGAAR
jgi:hypothetical protein